MDHPANGVVADSYKLCTATQSPVLIGEKHTHEKLLELGLETATDSWPSVYLHHETDLMLVLYVEDFLMSGPKETMRTM